MNLSPFPWTAPDKEGKSTLNGEENAGKQLKGNWRPKILSPEGHRITGTALGPHLEDQEEEGRGSRILMRQGLITRLSVVSAMP